MTGGQDQAQGQEEEEEVGSPSPESRADNGSSRFKHCALERPVKSAVPTVILAVEQLSIVFNPKKLDILGATHSAHALALQMCFDGIGDLFLKSGFRTHLQRY